MDENIEVEGANKRFYTAFESLSLEEMDKVWNHDENTICIHPGWDLVTGWLAIRESWERIFANTKSMKFIITNSKISINGDIAIVVCVENIESTLNEQSVKFGVLATNIFKHCKGKWLLVHHHGSTILNYMPPNICS